MAREVKIRTTYQADAAYMVRLARAIELDPRRNAQWKSEAIKRCNELSIFFMQANSDDSSVIVSPDTKKVG